MSHTSNSKPSRSRLLTLLLALLALAGLVETLARTVLMPDWRAVQPKLEGRNPWFGPGILPNLDQHHISPGNWDVRVITNRFGFRDQDEGFDGKLAGIWLLGDSNAFGFGVGNDATFAARLNQQGIPVANLATFGNQLPLAQTYLDRLRGLGYRPRLVVYAMSLNHSLEQPPQAIAELAPAPAKTRIGAAARLRERLGLLARPELLRFSTWKHALLGNSAAYVSLKAGLVTQPGLQGKLAQWRLVEDPDLQESGEPFLIRIAEAARTRDRVAQVADLAARLRDHVRAEFGVPLVIVVLPSLHQLYPARFDRFVAATGLDRAGLDPRRPKAELQAALAARGVPVIDVEPALAAAANPLLVFRWNAHFNVQGHAAIADFLAGKLREELR